LQEKKLFYDKMDDLASKISIIRGDWISKIGKVSFEATELSKKLIF
jgi:hypothetical protein